MTAANPVGNLAQKSYRQSYAGKTFVIRNSISFLYLCIMKIVKLFLLLFIFIVAIAGTSEVSAQCAMCTLNAENSTQNGNTEGNGLNSGILYLLAAPYIAVAAVGFIWFKKYKRKNIPVHMKGGKINLN